MCRYCGEYIPDEETVEVEEEEKTIEDLYEQMEEIKATLDIILNKLRNMDPNSH